MTDISPLRDFVTGMTGLADTSDGDEAAMITGTRDLLAKLVARDDWLPEEYTREGDTYRQYLLHCDPKQRFSVVSFNSLTSPFTSWMAFSTLPFDLESYHFEFVKPFRNSPTFELTVVGLTLLLLGLTSSKILL